MTGKVVITPPPSSIYASLSTRSQECVRRLVAHEAGRIDLTEVDHGQPLSKLAAVLVLIYEQDSELRVLLTTRSKALRTHAGQTALPGGKVDEEDTDLVSTAFREAYEEVALPLHCPSIYPLCLLEPFISAYRLLVTPVVALLTDNTVLDHLKAHEGEVSKIFTFPLEAVLEPEKLLLNEELVERGSEDWIYPEEFHNTNDVLIESFNNSSYRMHRFRSAASPLKGLSADILIKTAEVAYAKKPSYERYAHGQVHGTAAIVDVLKSTTPIKPEYRDAEP